MDEINFYVRLFLEAVKLGSVVLNGYISVVIIHRKRLVSRFSHVLIGAPRLSSFSVFAHAQLNSSLMVHLWDLWSSVKCVNHALLNFFILIP